MPDTRTRTSQPQPASVPDRALDRALALARVDLPSERRKPKRLWLAVATITSVVGSLAADMVLVAVGTALFPSTRGYAHFQFADYGKLTVVGVMGACIAWPIVMWISSSPRWLFFRLAVLVTVVLWLPDVYILLHRQPAKAVVVLMVMHLAIALVTYNVLVHVAPPARRFRRVEEV